MALSMVARKDEIFSLGKAIRPLFPIFALEAKRRGKPLAYLDSAATAQKPASVLERVNTYLSSENANIHRGAYELSGRATANYEHAREGIAAFIGAGTPSSIIFTRGTTASLNLIARALSPRISKKSGVLLTLLEHHSNIVPWQIVCKERGASIDFVDIGSDGRLTVENVIRDLKSKRPAVLSITQISNAIGTVVALQDIIDEAHRLGIVVVVDAAQSVAHVPLDISALNCDFLAFSGHKLYGPTGIGVLYGRPSLLEELEPCEGGGGMIATVTQEGSTWAEVPQRFEAGTPPIAEAIGLAEAVRFLSDLGMERLEAHERSIFEYAAHSLLREDGVSIHGPSRTSVAESSVQKGIIAFSVNGIHPHDLSTVADDFNVQIRAGHHCAMPLLKHLGVGSTARVSFGAYSATEDIDALMEAIRMAKKRFT